MMDVDGRMDERMDGRMEIPRWWILNIYRVGAVQVTVGVCLFWHLHNTLHIPNLLGYFLERGGEIFGVGDDLFFLCHTQYSRGTSTGTAWPLAFFLIVTFFSLLDYSNNLLITRTAFDDNKKFYD